MLKLKLKLKKILKLTGSNSLAYLWFFHIYYIYKITKSDSLLSFKSSYVRKLMFIFKTMFDNADLSVSNFFI